MSVGILFATQGGLELRMHGVDAVGNDNPIGNLMYRYRYIWLVTAPGSLPGVAAGHVGALGHFAQTRPVDHTATWKCVGVREGAWGVC